MKYNEHKVAATRGAALLDEKMPGWHKRINTEALDIGVCAQCTLGQLCGDYNLGVLMLGYNSILDPELNKHGFTLEPGLYDIEGRIQQWKDLTEAWVELINRRRAAG